MTKRKQMSIALTELKILTLNMCHERKKPFIDDILPSITERGLFQPLLVRREGNHWGVVAGRRRWWCLKEISKAEKKPGPVPCIVLKEGDDAAAIEASLMENIGR